MQHTYSTEYSNAQHVAVTALFWLRAHEKRWKATSNTALRYHAGNQCSHLTRSNINTQYMLQQNKAFDQLGDIMTSSSLFDDVLIQLHAYQNINPVRLNMATVSPASSPRSAIRHCMDTNERTNIFSRRHNNSQQSFIAPNTNSD